MLYRESKKVEDYKFKILKDTGSVMVVEEELNLRAANELGIKNAIDSKDVDTL